MVVKIGFILCIKNYCIEKVFNIIKCSSDFIFGIKKFCIGKNYFK